MMDHESAIAMGALAVDPTNPNVIYAGTGEAAQNLDTYGGAGIMKSTDGGATWRPSGLTNVAAFARIAVHRSNPNIVFAAAVRNNAGFYRSADAGRTWSRIVPYAITDITINPANPDELWVGGTDSAVLHSLDAGLTFTPSGNGIGAGAIVGRVSVQVAPSMPSVLYALVHELTFPNGSYTRIYKSANSGASWRLILDNDPDILAYGGVSQGEYNNVIAVKPDDPNVVLAGGVVIARTTDGGDTWSVIDTALHLDHHALVFDPSSPSRLYAGNDGGMYRSEDAGLSFTRITTGLAITQFYALAIDQSQPHVTYGGTQDNGTISTEAKKYAVGGAGVVGAGDGFVAIVDADDPNIIYFEQPRGRILKRDLAAGTVVSFFDGIQLNDANDLAAWSAPFVNDPIDPDIFYCGRSRVYRRTRGTSWSAISPRFRTAVNAIGISPIDSRIIYAGSGLDGASSILLSNGTPLGELKVTTDGGTTWLDRSSATGLPNRVITDIVPSPRDTATAYISYSGFRAGHIFRTTDYGATWSDVSHGLPDTPVNALAIDPLDPAIIYAGTDIGVYITTDGGGTWESYNQGLPNAVVADMAIHNASRTLRVATHGRSMWEISLASPSPAPSITIPAGGENWMGGSRQHLAWSGLAGSVRLEYSLDGGDSWSAIAENIASGTYQWSVPEGESRDARVRATEMEGAMRTLASKAFTIEPRGAGGIVAGTLKGYPCWGLAYDGEHLWAAVENSDTLLELDPATLATIGIVKIDDGGGKHGYSDITYHPGRETFYIHDISNAKSDGSGQAWLCEVTKDGRIVNRWSSPCVYPTGLAWLNDVDGGRLIASDIFGDQSLYLIDPATGAVTRTITRATKIDFGPAGITATGDGRGFWQVIGNFDFNSGPHGSSMVRASVDDPAASCAFELELTADSTLAGGYNGWGKLFARGVERDPADGNLWVSNYDGAIYKVVPCDAVASAVPAAQRVAPADATLDPIAPNPLAAPARIRFTLRHAANVRLALDDARGDESMVIDERAFDAGAHEAVLDAAPLPSGIYYCRMIVDGAAIATRSVIVVR
jgi:photosystem II stability/assembly factor-like uncharacterized protein